MKYHPVAALLLGVMLVVAGCQTVNSRIREKPEVFASVDPATQDKIRQGIVDLGYTPDMVYLALGNPDEKHESISADGKSSVWIYNTYYTHYDGTVPAGYYRHVHYDRFWRTARVFYTPAYVDTYHDEKEQRIRVEFRNGRAAVISQMKS